MARILLTALSATSLICSAAAADAPTADNQTVASELNPQEQAFCKLMNHSALAGTFTVEKAEGQPGGVRDAERYVIEGVTKVKDHQWTVNSRIQYGQLDVSVPVPVEVHWADDAPVICVTNLSIPLVGDGFTARVMFYDDHYVGTWRHGKVGGLMYGRVEHTSVDEPSGTEPPRGAEGQPTR